jgi:hypothetical protein
MGQMFDGRGCGEQGNASGKERPPIFSACTLTPNQLRHGMLCLGWMVQVRIARVVMTTLFKLGAALGDDGRPRGAVEADVLNLLSGVLQNVATHADNRTRFYKAELTGSSLWAANSAPVAGVDVLGGVEGEVQGGGQSPVGAAVLAARPKARLLPAVRGAATRSSDAAAARPVAPPPRDARAGRSLDAGLRERREHYRWIESAFAVGHGEQQRGVGRERQGHSKGGFLGRVEASMIEAGRSERKGGGGDSSGGDDDGRVDGKADSQLAPRLAKILRRPLTHMWQPTHEQRRSVGKSRWSPGASG